jgi:ribosomal protein L29
MKQEEIVQLSLGDLNDRLDESREKMLKLLANSSFKKNNREVEYGIE